MRWLVVLAALIGCDEVFSVDHVDLDVDAPGVLDAPEACPTIGYAAVAGAPPTSMYRYSPSLGLTWEKAELMCETESLHKITHLVVFDSPSEEAALRAFVPALPQFWQVFTGYARNANAQGGMPFQFTAVTGEPLDLASPIWEKVDGPEPDDGGTTNDEETITFFEMTRNMSDGIATSELGFICECDGKPAIQDFKIR